MLRKQSYYVLFAFFGLVGAIAFAASYGARVENPLTIGQGSSVTTQAIFDIGNGSSNPFMQSTTGGVLQLSNNGGTNLFSIPTVTDTAAGIAATQTLTNKTLTSPVINSGSLSNPTVTSGLTVSSGGSSITGGETIVSGGLGVTGATTLNSTGGNVPHACSRVVASGSQNADCSAGQIATGGGTDCSGGNGNVIVSLPQPGLAGWTGLCSGASTSTIAVCCNY